MYTLNIQKRVYEHRNKLVEGFSKKYNLTDIVHFEIFDDICNAIESEKRLKGWTRCRKDELVNSSNPGWLDLYDEIMS